MTTMEDIERLTAEMKAICDEVDKIKKVNAAAEDRIIVKHKKKTYKITGFLARQIVRLIEENEAK